MTDAQVSDIQVCRLF